MNISQVQLAYTKGLDVAENIAIEKLSQALDGCESGPFNNPKMEEIRQRILNTIPRNKDYRFILDYLCGREVDESQLIDVEKAILRLFKECNEISGPYCTRTKISTKIKQFMGEVRVQVLKHYGEFASILSK